MIMNLEEWYPGRREYDFYMYFNKGGEYTVRKLLKTVNTGSAGIMEWQQGCKKEGKMSGSGS